MLELDHIVVVCADLRAGLDHVQNRLGIAVPPGGRHPLMGTMNHLVRLGEASFLEVIAPDPDAPLPGRPRWFGMDRAGAPRLTHWVVRTTDMDGLHPTLPPDSGPAIPVTRGDLSWRLTVPEDGSLPMGGIFPTVVEWSPGPLPPRAMPGMGLDLLELHLAHPQADAIRAQVEPLFPDDRVSLAQGDRPTLRALIGTPDGPKWLD